MRKRKRYGALLLALLLALLTLMLAFGAQAATTRQKAGRGSQPVCLEQTAITLKTGSAATLKLKGNKGAVTWKAADGKIASVSKQTRTSVRITGKRQGRTTVTATLRATGQRYVCQVTVKKKARIAVVDVPSLNRWGNAGAVVAALRRCGAQATLVRSVSLLTDSYDGLVLPGGIDVAPATYHARRDAHTRVYRARLDQVQLQAIDRFVKAGKPILGICRGMQLLNVYFDGTLKQHISGHGSGSHVVNSTSGSVMRQLFGASVQVQTSHHQAVDRLGTGLVVTQRARKDRQVEAVEHESLPIWGVQWHPEMNGARGSKLLKAFIARCEKGA